MKKIIAMFAIAASVAACSEATEEVEDAAYEAEAAAE